MKFNVLPWNVRVIALDGKGRMKNWNFWIVEGDILRTKEYNMMDIIWWKIIIYFSLKRNNILSWFLSWSYDFFDGMRISNENMFTYKQNFYNLITIRLFQTFSFVADITILSFYDDDKTYFYSYFYSYW